MNALFTTSLILCVGQAASAPAAPDIKLPPPVSTADVLSGFMQHLWETKAYPDEAVRFIHKQYEGRRGGDDLAPLLDESLAVLSPEFKAGLDAVAAEKTDDAAQRFEKLAGSDDPYIAVNAAFFAVQAYVARENLRDASALLTRVFAHHADLTKYTTHADHLLFLLAYTQAHMLDYDHARATLEHFLQQFPAAPERYRSTAQQILTELQRRDPGMMGDVYDLMSFARRELSIGRTDTEVSRRQSEAVALLDRLIKQAEDEENKQGKGGGKGGGRNRSRMQRNQQSQSPRQQSELNPGGGANRDLKRAHQAAPGDSWGKMPPKQRDQILQALQKQFPSQYRDLVEQYYRQVAKDAPHP